MLTEYENRPALGHNKQSYCFRMARSLLLLVCSPLNCCWLSLTLNMRLLLLLWLLLLMAVLVLAHVNCAVSICSQYAHIYLYYCSRVSSPQTHKHTHFSLLKPAVLIMRKQNQFFGLLNFTASAVWHLMWPCVRVRMHKLMVAPNESGSSTYHHQPMTSTWAMNKQICTHICKRLSQYPVALVHPHNSRA